MIRFEEEYFQKFAYTSQQIGKYFQNAAKDLQLAKGLESSEAAYRIGYESIIKVGIAVIAKHGYKVRSNMGHHYKILQKIADITGLRDEINFLQQVRRKRNIDLYEGGFSFSETDVRNLIGVAEKIFRKAGGDF